MIDFVCPHCKKTLRVPEQFLGQTGKCNHCGKAITILVAPPPSTGANFDTPIPDHPESQSEPIKEMSAEDFKRAVAEGVKAAKQEEYQQSLAIAQANAARVRQNTLRGCVGCFGIFVALIFFSAMIGRSSTSKQDTAPPTTTPVATPVATPIATPIAPTPQPQPVSRPVQQYQEPVEQVPRTQTVYITNTGKKYHRAGCRSLGQSSISISLADAQAQGYEPCGICHP